MVTTIVELAYVLRLRATFTPFEKLFFFSAGASEIVGELFLVLVMLVWLYMKQRAALSSNNCRRDVGAGAGGDYRYQGQGAYAEGSGGASGRGLSVADAKAHLEKLSRDPIHVLKDTVSEYFNLPEESSVEGEKAQGERKGQLNGSPPTVGEDRAETEKTLLKTVMFVAISLVLTFLPTLVFGVVLVVLRRVYGFESPGDEGVMLSLTLFSFLALFMFVVFVSYAIHWRIYVPLLNFDASNYYQSVEGEGNDNRALLKGALRCIVVGGALIYSVEKVMEVSLLCSRSDRLAPSTLGQTLIIFQMVELVSVANILYVLLLEHLFGHGDEPSPLDQLSRIENALVELQNAAKDSDDLDEGTSLRIAQEHGMLGVAVEEKLDALNRAVLGVTERLDRMEYQALGQGGQG